MYKIKLLILLLTSIIITSCTDRIKKDIYKISVGYIGGEYDGLVLSNQLSSKLNNFGLLDNNSRYEIQGEISHSQDLFITNIDNTSDREQVNSSTKIKIFDKKQDCFTYFFYESVSQFYILASSDKFISNKVAVEEIKLENTEYLVKKFVNSLDRRNFTCDEK